MIGIIIQPYRMIEPQAVRPPSWVVDGGGILGDRIEDWTPEQALTLTARLGMDRQEILRSSGLSTRDEIVIVPAWRCTLTHQRGSVIMGPYTLEDLPEGLDLRLSIPPGSLDEGIALRTSICLHRRTGGDRDPAIATRPGSILWHDHPTGRVTLLGASRFPVSASDFAQSGLGEPSSLWRMTIRDDDLDAPLRRSVRLHINSANQRVLGAVTESWRDPGAAVVRQMLAFAVERELVLCALRHHQELGERPPEPHSLREMLCSTMSRRFPDMHPTGVHELRESDPSSFETHLQARLGLLQKADAG